VTANNARRAPPTDGELSTPPSREVSVLRILQGDSKRVIKKIALRLEILKEIPHKEGIIILLAHFYMNVIKLILSEPFCRNDSAKSCSCHHRRTQCERSLTIGPTTLCSITTTSTENVVAEIVRRFGSMCSYSSIPLICVSVANAAMQLGLMH